eukprot:762732-Hanusia_phi.AAC.2
MCSCRDCSNHRRSNGNSDEHGHDHEHGHSHEHGHEHGHTHEHMDNPGMLSSEEEGAGLNVPSGSFEDREKPIKPHQGRDWDERAFTVGIGGPVGRCSRATSRGCWF